MGANGPDKIVKLLFDTLSEDGVSVHQIVCRSGLDHRTVKKYLNLVIDIQKLPKIVMEQTGLRMVVRKAQ